MREYISHALMLMDFSSGLAMKKIPTKADKIADFFLMYAREHGDYLTNLKLQKLLYYAQAWHLALFDEELFSDDLQAWVHGPVVSHVYGRFKKYSWNPISEDVKDPHFDAQTRGFLEEVFDRYGSFSAVDLERMTHEESPWQKARGSLPLDQNSNAVLDRKEMREFFKRRLENG